MELVSGTRQVVVESCDSLEVVEAAARRLWPLTAGDAAADGGQIGFTSATGTVSEPVVQELMPAETMPTHLLVPQQETPEDRRRGWL